MAGADNAVADALSRAAIEEVRIGVDYGKMADLQRQDPETKAYKMAVTALKWEEMDVDNGQRKLLQASVQRIHGSPQAPCAS